MDRKRMGGIDPVNINFYADYTKAGVGTAPSSPPTISIYSIHRDTDVETAVVTDGAMTALTLVGRYKYRLTTADLQNFDYHARVHTDDATVDIQEPPALWVNWSVAVTTDATGRVTVGTNADKTGYSPANGSLTASVIGAGYVAAVQAGLATAANQGTLLSAVGSPVQDDAAPSWYSSGAGLTLGRANVVAATGTTIDFTGANLTSTAGDYTGRRLYVDSGPHATVLTDPCTAHTILSGTGSNAVHRFTFAATQKETLNSQDVVAIVGA